MGKTILLADESNLLREGLAALCESTGAGQVVAQCSDGEQAWSLVRKLNPDIAILEHGLPRLHVLEIVRKLRTEAIPTRVIILSSRTDRKMILEALRGGVAGYLLKNCSVRELKEAIEMAGAGGVYVASRIGVDGIWSAPDRERPADPLDSLSGREHQVFSLMIEGLRPKEIAARLEVSPKTVDTYRSNLMRKLDIHDVAGLVKFAIQRKITLP